MKRLAYGIGLLLTFSIPTFAAKKILTVKAVTHQAEVREYKTSYTLPGSPGYSNTNCMGNATGNATDFGNTTSIHMNGNVNCHTTTTAPTPPETKDIRISRGFVTNIVEGEGFRYTIECTANWVGSNCAPLIDGEFFPAEIDDDTMWLRARRGGNQGKSVRIKYRIVDIRQAPVPAPAVQPAPSLYTNSRLEELKQQIAKNELEIKRRQELIERRNQTGVPPDRIVASVPAQIRISARTQAPSTSETSHPASVPVQEQTATVVVFKSAPEGAEITIDGKFVGSTPSTVRLDPGDHEIVIEKKGANMRRVAGGEVTLPAYRAWRRTLTVNPGSTLTVDAALETVR